MPPVYEGSKRVIARYIGSAPVSSVMIGDKSCFAGALPSIGCTFLAKLISSLILDEGTGDPTWSRATKAWGFNELGYLEELASGCAFFGGARLVRNFIRNSALDNATWSNTGLTITAGQTDYLGGTSAFLLMETAATSNHDIRDDGVSPGAGRVMIISVVAKANGRDQIRISDNAYGAVSATFDLSAGTAVSTVGTSTIADLGGGYYKCIAKTSGSIANSPFYPRIYIYNGSISYAGDITKGVILSHVQVSSVTNYDASYVPEYVSVGVVATPFFGAGIDGAKYFETDWQGAPIAVASLLGFRREASAINNLLHSRDLSNAAWSTKTNVTAAKTATGLDGIANTATTLTATAADAIILQPISLTSAARCASAYVKRRTGTGTISFTQDGGSTWTDITAQINGSTWSRVQITSTLANPSVGFKISTSGDAIDVDCVQNEAGAVATSPIVTTTATVSRNGDSLTYQTTGNIDAALGTLFCQYSVYEETVASPRVIIGLSTSAATANALLLHATGVATSSLSSGDGTTIFAKTGLGSAVNTKRKAAVSWGTGRSLTAGGLAPQAGVFSGTLPSTAIAPGAYTNGTFPINGYIGPVAIYNYKMTDAELQAITT